MTEVIEANYLYTICIYYILLFQIPHKWKKLITFITKRVIATVGTQKLITVSITNLSLTYHKLISRKSRNNAAYIRDS